MMLEEESDEEMRELAKEELNDSKARIEELERELKILLLPKDPNDEKNVILEIRAVSIREHKQILRSIRDRDADLAEQLANEHILHVMQNLKRQGYEQNETAGGV